MALLILNFSDFIEYSLSTPISSLFAAGRLWIPVAVISGVLILGGILPGIQTYVIGVGCMLLYDFVDVFVEQVDVDILVFKPDVFIPAVAAVPRVVAYAAQKYCGQ